MGRRVVGMLLVGAVALSACGGSDGGSETADDGGAAATYESPIMSFLGVDQPDDTDAMQEQFAEQERAVGEYTTACMAEQGFTYVHADQSSMAVASPDGEAEYGSDEWVAEYGFGITTQRYSQELIGADLKGMTDTATDTFEDPNDAYLETLGEAERNAYYAALYGDDTGPVIDSSMSEEEVEAAMEEHDRTAEPSGCQNEAYEEASGSSAANRFYEEYGTELEELYERIEADPRIVAWQEEAERCVAEAGYDYRPMEDLYPYFDERLAPIEERLYGDVGAEPPPDFEEMSPAEQQEWVEGNQPTLDEEGRALLAEVQAEELALAAVYHECDASEFDAEVYFEVAAELEQRFLDEHADELAEFAG